MEKQLEEILTKKFIATSLPLRELYVMICTTTKLNDDPALMEMALELIEQFNYLQGMIEERLYSK